MEFGRFGEWRVLFHPLFRNLYEPLRAESQQIAATLPPVEARQHPKVKLYRAVNRALTEVIPADPNAPDFRLRGELKLFRRLKGYGLPDRYRLFYVFSSTLRVIIVLYLNDESSLRHEGGRNDPYARFAALVRQGKMGEGFAPNWERIFEELRQQPPQRPE